MSSPRGHATDRLRAVADALIAALQRFGDPLAFLYTFTDYLVIALGHPFGMRLTRGQRSVVVRPSAPQSSFRQVGICDTRILLSGDREASNDADSALSSGVAFLSSLEALLLDESPTAHETISARLRAAFEVGGLPSDPGGVDLDPVEWAERPALLMPFEERLARFLAGERPSDPDVAGAPVRVLARTYANGRPSNHRLSMDQPTGHAVPSGADLPLVTGFAAWCSGSARSTMTNDVGPAASHVSIPCTVGGVPWLALWSPAPEGWRQAYVLYRDLLPRVLQQIRLTAQIAYADALIQAVDDEAREDQWRPVRLNERWAALGRVFPFAVPHIEIADAPPDTYGFSVGEYRGVGWRVHVSPNTAFPGAALSVVGTTWGALDIETLFIDPLRVRLRLADQHVALGSYRTAMGAFGHHMGRLMQESGVVGADIEAHRSGGIDYATWRRVTARLWPVWGMGEASRVLRAGGAGFPSNWFDDSGVLPPLGSPAELEVAVRDACRFYLAPRLQSPDPEVDSSFEPGWTVEWRLGDRSPEVETLGSMYASFIEDAWTLPTLPPFVEHDQRAGTTAVTLGLAEIVRNAVNECRKLSTLVRGGGVAESVMIFTIRATAVEVVVRLRQWFPGSRLAPESRAIAEIQLVERVGLVVQGIPIAETTQPVCVSTSGRSMIEASWRYRFSAVVPEPAAARRI